MANQRPVVILLLKAPLIGAVKSRLAADIGVVEAWQFYCESAQTVGSRLAFSNKWDVVLAITPRRSRRHIQHGLLRLSGLPTIDQGEGDIGRRMARCLARFAPRPRLLIGGDIPDVNSNIIEQSFANLATAEVCFGPAADGGFWLVGERGRPVCGQLFNNVSWSSPQTLSMVLSQAPNHVAVAGAPLLPDIDDGPTLAAWRDRTAPH